MQILSSSHAQHCLGYHIIFCPKYRHQVLEGAIEVELKRIVGEICKQYNWIIHALEIMPDHVHIFVQADHTTAKSGNSQNHEIDFSSTSFPNFQRFEKASLLGFWYVERWYFLLFCWWRFGRGCQAIYRFSKTTLIC